MAAALARAAPRRAPLRVVDLGAGLLSMLPRVLALARECEASGVDYFALEPEPGLWDENVQSLQGMGFSLEDGGEGRFWHEELQARVVLVREDFRALSPVPPPPPPPSLLLPLPVSLLYTHFLPP